jgi:hypothetical protein
MASELRLNYTHQPLAEERTSISGYYTVHKEVRQPQGEREVLYIVGRACMESACCGTGNWEYGMVPGYILNWQARKNDEGLPVTEVEPIGDPSVKADLEEYIKKTEGVSRVEFW